MVDVPKRFQQVLFLGLAALLFNYEASQQVFFGQVGFSASGVDWLLDDANLAIADWDADEFEEHSHILPQALVGLPCDFHPIIEENEVSSVLAVVDHYRKYIEIDADSS